MLMNWQTKWKNEVMAQVLLLWKLLKSMIQQFIAVYDIGEVNFEL